MAITDQIVSQTTVTRREPGPDLTRDVFDNVDLSLFELFRETARAGKSIIEGKTFRNCRIEGPAVLLALGGVNFNSTDFGYSGGDVRNLVLRPVSPTNVIGAIPLRDCTFTNCLFFAVGFTGPEAFIQQILAVDAGKPK